jgi:PAS domain S-box-containing protein
VTPEIDASGRDRPAPGLYDLAMIIASEPRPRQLAAAVLQRLLSHTGSACGAVLLHPPRPADGAGMTAEVYAALGNPALRALEGKTLNWSGGLPEGRTDGPWPDGFPGEAEYHHALALTLPELGSLMLFAEDAPRQAAEYPQLFAPILALFARNLGHALESEANTRALQQSETRFRCMLESTSDWVWEVNAEGVFTFSNDKVRDLLGYAPDEVVGRTPFDFMPAGEARRLEQAFLDIAAGRRPFSGLENVNLHREGREIVLETSGVPILDKAGNYLGYRGIDRDITVRRQAQEALIKAKEAAETTCHAKALFLSSISHELRTPLNAILGHAQFIEMLENLPPAAAASAHEIRLAGNSLLAQIDGILDLANIESGRGGRRGGGGAPGPRGWGGWRPQPARPGRPPPRPPRSPLPVCWRIASPATPMTRSCAGFPLTASPRATTAT